MEGYIELDFLQIEDIVADKLDEERRSYLVKWKGLNCQSWVTIETILSFSLNLLLRYYATIISTLDFVYPNLNFEHKVQKFIELVDSSCEKREMNSTVKSYLTVYGLKFPPSEREVLLENLKYLVKNRIRPSLNIMQDLRQRIILEKILDERSKQLRILKQTELQINLIADNQRAITIENDVDLETLPEYFIYINNYLPGRGVEIPSDPPIGCDCSSECAWSKQKIYNGSCCPDIAGAEPAYDLNKRLSFSKRKPIYECNKKCTCDKSCLNRVVQNGSNLSLEIFRTFNETGWGVRTLDFVPKGTFVAKYVGEIITYEEAKHRCDEYLFDIDFNYASETDECAYTVDAFQYGNISRFINHSCDPNLSVFSVLIDCLDPDLHEIAFFASRDISAGEEICFNYNKKMKCKCGSIKCKLK